MLALCVSCEEQRDWVMFRGETGQGATSTSVRPPLAVKWKLQLQLKGDIAKFFNPPVILDNTIYFGSYDGNFYALDIESGYMRWVFKTGNHINSIPSGDADNVYFGSDDGKVYAVSRKTGEEKWSYATGEYVQSLVTKYEDMIVFVTNQGAGYFLNTDGKLLFTIPNGSWEKYTFQIYMDTMYFAPGGSHSRSGLSAFNIKKRNADWELDPSMMAASWYSVPAVDENRVYTSCATYYGDYLVFDYYALNRKSGLVLWQASVKAAFSPTSQADSYDLLYDYIELLDYMAPSLWRDLVIYTSGDTKVRAYYTNNGLLAWEHSFDFHTSSAPTIAGDRLYFGLDGSDSPRYILKTKVPPKLVCLAATDGRQLWDMPIEGKVLSAPVIAGKWIVFGTDQHIFYVIEEVF
jgi:outer membrane protein assembly factor BamB